MSLLGSISRKVSPKEVVNYFRRTLIGSGELGRKEINQIKGKLKNLSQEDKERLRTADLEDLTPEEVDLVMFGFVGFKDFGMPNKTIVQMKGNEFSQFKKKINKIVDDVIGGKTESVEEFTLEDGKIRSNMVEKNKEIPTGDATQLTLFNQGGKASMLKPDYIDIDGDGNKTESMKIAAKQAKERDGMSAGGVTKTFSKKLKELTSEEIAKLKKYFTRLNKEKFPDEDSWMSESERNPSYDVEDLVRQIEKEYKGEKEFEDAFFVTGSYGNDFMLGYDEIDEIVGRKVVKRKKPKSDKKFTADDIPFAEGGNVDDQMSKLMQKEQEPPMESEMPMESDEEMEDNYLDFILDEALTEEEEDMLMSKLEQDEQLSMLFDKVVEVASEFAGSGPVEGPGTGVSDSIPARLSDGEFVFTAKAVEEIGADELMRMMKDAEMRADERQGMANGGEMEEETVKVESTEPATPTQVINVRKETVGTQASVQEEEDLVKDSITRRMMAGRSSPVS